VVLTGDFSYPSHCDNLCCTLAALGFKAAFDPHTPTHVRGGKLDWVLLRGCRERPRVSLGRQEQDHHQLVAELLPFFVTDWPLRKAVCRAWYQARYTAYQW
jgi:hypothetical protein